MTTQNNRDRFVPPTGGFGRVFESMYKGSMMGKGLAVFAVWPYVISNMRGHPEYGAVVELNPELLRFMIGCDRAEIEEAIEKFCEPDAASRNKREEGRKLVKLGEYLYRVVNGADYIAIRKKEGDLVKHQEAQKRYMSKKKGGAGYSGPTMAERTMEKLDREGDEHGVGRMEEIAAGVVPGALGSFGPEAQEVVLAAEKEKKAKDMKLKSGDTLKKYIKRKVEADPLTIADKAAVERLERVGYASKESLLSQGVGAECGVGGWESQEATISGPDLTRVGAPNALAEASQSDCSASGERLPAGVVLEDEQIPDPDED